MEVSVCGGNKCKGLESMVSSTKFHVDTKGCWVPMPLGSIETGAILGVPFWEGRA
jgi:hypothetical protein